MCGFELNADGKEPFNSAATMTLSGATYSSTQARTGTFSIRCNPGSGASQSIIIPAGSYVHFGMYVVTKPSLDRRIIGTISANTLNVRLTSTGALGVYENTTLLGTSSAAFASPGWHWVALRATSGTSVPHLQIDGVTEVTATSTISGTGNSVGFVGAEASAAELYIDDFIIDDANLLQPSKVALLLPISDNARGANWFKADGSTTTNLFQSVDNIPPAGVASANEAATPLASIRHTGGANNAYDANMTTYSSAGVAAIDTVIAVMSWVRHGEDIATGTKVLASGLVSNPAPGVGSNFNAGNNAGAHAAETNLWLTQVETIQVSPSVTIGSSPVLRISRPETASRVACIDFMGVTMAWTIGVVTDRVPFTPRYPSLLAQ
jgi:hypothetical protein